MPKDDFEVEQTKDEDERHQGAHSNIGFMK
jgi:hypothetical protein